MLHRNILCVPSSAIVVALLSLCATGIVLPTLRGDLSQRDGLKESLSRLSSDFGAWRGTPLEIDQKSLLKAQIEGCYSASFQKEDSRRNIVMNIYCGAHGPIAAHLPQICLNGGGYEQVGSPGTLNVPYGESRQAVFSYLDFRSSNNPYGESFRIYYSLRSDTPWVSPDNPRLYFAGKPFLLKMYVIQDHANGATAGTGEVLEFLKSAMPRVEQELFPATDSPINTATRDRSLS